MLVGIYISLLKTRSCCSPFRLLTEVNLLVLSSLGWDRQLSQGRFNLGCVFDNPTGPAFGEREGLPIWRGLRGPKSIRNDKEKSVKSTRSRETDRDYGRATGGSKNGLHEEASALKPYLTPLKPALRALGIKGDVPERFEVSREQLKAFLSVLLRGVTFDEEWYLAQYPDIADAVAGGHFRSARDHFVEHGYWEGRHPGHVVVDEEWYANVNSDVAEGVALGEIRTCQEHFDQHGRQEGRLPYEL